MVRDWRRLALVAACGVACGLGVSCNGNAFNSGSGGAPAASGNANASGSAGKSAAGSGHAGTGAMAGSGTGGATGGTGSVDPTDGGAPDPSSAGMGGSSEPEYNLPAEGLVFWFKADAGVVAEQERVKTWQDQSGNGFNALQLVAELRPTVTKTELLPLPLLAFDGDGDFLELPELKNGLHEGLSFFGVAGRSAEDEGLCAPLVELSNGPEIDDVNVGYHENAVQYEVQTEVLTALGGTFPLGKVSLIEAHHNGDPVQPALELRANTVQVGSNGMQPPADVPRVSNFIGRSLYALCTTFNGGIGELILYSRKVSSDERIAIEQYLMKKWQCCQ